jgi:hypothetical protein
VVKKTVLNALNVRFAQFFKNGEVQGNSKVKKESGRLAGDP